MKFQRYKIFAAAMVVVSSIMAGCASSKISQTSYSSPEKSIVSTIAFMPGGGLVSDAVGVELSNRGFTIIDASTTSTMMVRLGINEVSITKPESLEKFRKEGIDALLVVHSSSSYDGQPQSVSARVNSTQNGRVIAGITWQNGFGGRQGSIADRMMRQGITEAASEISNALAERILPK